MVQKLDVKEKHTNETFFSFQAQGLDWNGLKSFVKNFESLLQNINCNKVLLNFLQFMYFFTGHKFNSSNDKMMKYSKFCSKNIMV